MKPGRWIDTDSEWIAPKPFFIVGKTALDEPVCSNLAGERTNTIVDRILFAMFVGAVLFTCFPQLGVVVMGWIQ